MRHSYPRPFLAAWLLLTLWLLAAGGARAQAPAWNGAAAGSPGQASDGSTTQGVATDAGGNVFVTGYFTGDLLLGSTLLHSAGNRDLFVAKWVPATGTWAWAVRGGGTGNDEGRGIAVSGSSLYVAGYVTNSSADGSMVRLGDSAAGTYLQYGTSPTPGEDLLLLKYTDQGGGAAFNWSQVGGGTAHDYGNGVAISGSSIYVGGTLQNNAANAFQVVFGGSGTVAGTRPQAGAAPASLSDDLVLAKYTDQGGASAFQWSQVGGGTGTDQGNGVAVSGTSVYLTGSISNDATNSQAVTFGGSGVVAGTRPQAGASAAVSSDLVLAGYTDQGSTGLLRWSQVGGGTGADVGLGVAASGSRVCVTGLLLNNTSNAQQVLLGGSGTTSGTQAVYGAASNVSQDLLLAAYTDQGSTATMAWTQVGGGIGSDRGYGVAVSGSSIFVTGTVFDNSAGTLGVVFGGGGTTPGTSPLSGAGPSGSDDLVLARFQDNGTTGSYQWAAVGGGAGGDRGYGVAVQGQRVLAAGFATPVATFGPTVLATPPGSTLAVLATLTDPTLPLLARAASSGAALTLYPNPSGGAAMLTGTAPGATVQVLDALGRVAATATADATGTARLAGLMPGLYLVRAGAATARLAVE